MIIFNSLLYAYQRVIIVGFAQFHSHHPQSSPLRDGSSHPAVEAVDMAEAGSHITEGVTVDMEGLEIIMHII
jgi:hypothetical protein